jgi:uncharacterized protein (TIGR02145 family)
MKKKTTILAGLLLTGAVFFMSCGGGAGGTMKDKDGNTYKTVKIGKQEWMAENLNYNTSKGSWYYNNDSTNGPKYGKLYEWETACKVCPDGWHLPSDSDWTQMIDYLVANGYNYDSTKKGNKIAKSLAATTLWNESSDTGAIGNDLSANNRSGFNALPGGYRYYNGHSYNLGDIGFWWTSTRVPFENVWYRWVYYLSGNKHIGRDLVADWFASSVRCVKDSVKKAAK